MLVHSSSELYGSDRSLLGIAEAAVAAGHHVLVLLPGPGALAEALLAAGAQVRHEPIWVLRRSEGILGFLASALGGLVTSVRLARILRAHHGPSIIISNTSAVLSGMLVAKLTGFSHTWIVREIYAGELERRLFSALLGTASTVIAVSGAARNQLGRRTRARAVVVHSGAVLPPRSAVHMTQFDGSRPMRILCAGRISRWKGQDLLMQALASMSGSTSAECRVVGGEYGGAGEVSRSLASLRRDLHLEHVVELLPEVSDLSAHYRWADVVVLPSTRPEPFGKVVVEGMASGTCVVASDAGGPSEVVASGRNGVLFRMGVVTELAGALERLAASPRTLRALAAQALDDSVSFDSRRSAEAVLKHGLSTATPTRG